MPAAPLPLEDLKSKIHSGEIHTVIVAITDMQGRLQGKRLDADYFLSDVLEHGTEGCNYLVAVDTVDAGTGETVLIVSGSSARMASGMKDCPIDAAVVGIVDQVDVTAGD